MLHTPSAKLRSAGENERHDLIAAVREIFALKDNQ
jgi:glutamyl-tRNA reductase